MSLINPRTVFSDIEKKMTALLKEKIVDPKSAGRPSKSPFIVIGSELQHSQHFPHIIVQCIDMPSTVFALGSKHRTMRPLIQLTVYSTNKKQLNEIKDEVLYDVQNNRTETLSWGLSRMVIRTASTLPYNRELKVHAFLIQFECVYYHIIT